VERLLPSRGGCFGFKYARHANLPGNFKDLCLFVSLTS
jgi:hypothetical protein